MVYHLKIIIIGDPGVGKTSLVKRFVSDQFSKDYRSSIGTNIFIKKSKFNSKEYSLHLWDIAGQERWENMRHLYYRGSNGALIVGDLSRRNTFDQINKFWIPDLKKNCGNIPSILIANKNDLNSTISPMEIQEMSKNSDMDALIYTSAKEGENVDQSFEMISKLCFKVKR